MDFDLPPKDPAPCTTSLGQRQDACTHPPGHKLSRYEAMDIFMRGVNALPGDVIRSAVLEKYATAERDRHRLLLATWDLEATKRKVHTLEEIQRHLEFVHAQSVSEFRFWHTLYTDQGFPELTEDELHFGDQLSSAAEETDPRSEELTVGETRDAFGALFVSEPS